MRMRMRRLPWLCWPLHTTWGSCSPLGGLMRLSSSQVGMRSIMSEMREMPWHEAKFNDVLQACKVGCHGIQRVQQTAFAAPI